MPDTRYAFAHGEPILVPAPDGVDDAISAVMAAHRDELVEALKPFDVDLDDLAQPTWMRVVRMHEVESGPTVVESQTRADVADLPPCDCGSVDKNGDDLGEHDPTCPYHLEAVRRWGLTVLPGDERPTDLEGD